MSKQLSFELLDIDTLSQRLSIPKNTIYYQVSQKKIPFYKIGKHLRFDIDEILKAGYSEVQVEFDLDQVSDCSLTTEGEQKSNHNLEDPFK